MNGARLIVSGAQNWLRAALLDGEDLIEAAVDAPGGPAPDTPGTVILGRVKAVSKPLGAAFVNIGIERDGFLPVAETKTPPHEGQAVCVRVTAPGVDGKGPKLSAKVTPPENIAAPGAAKPPRVLTPAPPAPVRLLQGLAETPDVSRDTICDTICDTAGAMREISAWAETARPEIIPHLKLWNRPEPLFEAEGAEAALEAALAEDIPLPGGGRVTVERTRLGVVIDVDAGEAAARGGGSGGLALAVNLEAAAAVARALRARNLSGLIIADFMKMKALNERRQVLRVLDAASQGDPAGLRIGGFTGLGLVEMTRARRGPALEDALKGFGG
ncbi:MAG: ribonuclease E/G [Rhodospirillales bacterium]